MNEMSYQEKFSLLRPWQIEILVHLKKELKSDHLRKDSAFAQKYFKKKIIDKISVEELTAAYSQELGEGNEEVAEWIASRWVLRHAEVYQFFAEKLIEINPKFDEIEVLPEEFGNQLMNAAAAQFGAKNVYIFSVLNAVAFSESLYAQLRQAAEKGEQIEAKPLKEESPEEMKKRYESELMKLTDRFEKRFLGIQKKYIQDVEGYKKQIAALQRKLGEVHANIG